MITRTSPPHAEFFPPPPAEPHALARRAAAVAADLRELARFWPVVQNMALQDLRVRYQRSFLGFFWSLLNPVLMMATMTVVFAHWLGRGDRWQDYALYLFAGQVPWLLLSGSLNDCAFSIISNEGLIRKIYVPKLVFPLSRVYFHLVNFALSLVALFVLMIPLGARFSWALLFLPVSIALFTVFSLGLGILIALLNTFYRDCGHLVGVFLQAWYFTTPILYDPARMPSSPWFLRFNPAYPFIAQFQAILARGAFPAPWMLVASAALALVSLVAGYAAFRAHEHKLIFRL
jgi:ABC-2 type transport system permease protein/lipopolysaccharide transport system permease protein